MTADDLLRRLVVFNYNADMQRNTFAWIDRNGFSINLGKYFATESAALAEFEKPGLLTLNDKDILIFQQGKYSCEIFAREQQTQKSIKHYLNHRLA